MDNAVNAVLHFDTLIWHWPIAIYLFLAGISAGSVMMAVAVKRQLENSGQDIESSGILKAMALIAPVSVMLGLGILIVDLTKPLEFWKMMIYWNPSSVMFWGVMGLSAYVGVLMVYLGLVFKSTSRKIFTLIPWINPLFDRGQSWTRAIEVVLLVLAVGVGAYTGLLLSALKAYPLLNNPLLPLLFLVSGISSGAASTILFGMICFGGRADDSDIHLVHKFERPVLITEIGLLALFFIGLGFGGEAAMMAVNNALSNEFWAMVFWGLVVGCGMALPWLLQWLLPNRITHNRVFVSLCCLLSLTGVFALRHYILYTGQMVVA